jgi:hypothetical protein
MMNVCGALNSATTDKNLGVYKKITGLMEE